MLYEALVICAVMALLSIDVRTIGGTLISRPLVVAPLTGWILGDIKTGFMVAYFIELVWVGMLPVGAYLPVEALPVTVIATFFASHMAAVDRSSSEAIIMFAIMISIPFGFMSRWLESHIRELNSKLSEKLEDQFSGERLPDIALVQYANIGLSFAKIFLVCFLPMYFGYDVISRIYGSLPANITGGLLTAFYIAPLVGIAVVLDLFLLKKHVLHLLLAFFVSFILYYVFKVSPFIIMAVGVLAGIIVLKFFYKEETSV